PERWVKVYEHWMTNIRDWCISRQLWWGHRIPAWYCGACSKTTVAREDPAACVYCKRESLTQDPDVLDTWFSSALWPFSTLGWPDQTRDLKVFYPTSLMITGFDILFFWVARMMMMGLEFMGDVPFREVYIHQLVRDADKQKMSKTKGNVIDPLVVTEKYGTDAVRFTLAIMSSPGTDIALSEDRMEGYRAFANKIWNAARFVFMSLEKAGAPAWVPPTGGNFVPVPDTDGKMALEDRWIFSRLSQLARDMAKAWDTYRYHEAADLMYHFFWHEFCDWYLEIKKLSFEAIHEKPAAMPPAFENLCRAFDVALRLLHPMMPFITEELWQRLASRDDSIALARFPKHDTSLLDDDAEREMALLQDIIVNIRNLRAELKVESKRKIPVEMYAANGAVAQLSGANRQAIERLSNLSGLHLTSQPLQEAGGALRALPDYSLKIALANAVDLDAERARLRKEQQKLEQELATLARQLNNEQFLAKAPAPVVANLRARREEVTAQHEKVVETLRKISS
ncbi:MAG: class I tRNA ligase family protein, partial [Acidobacteria bacterium]|nr:class I tRNA ligase family protein [Acidobacteriota bacterium]